MRYSYQEKGLFTQDAFAYNARIWLLDIVMAPIYSEGEILWLQN